MVTYLDVNESGFLVYKGVVYIGREFNNRVFDRIVLIELNY